MRNWRRYIGLPHVFGADPDAGEGADCLRMVFNLLEDLGRPHPPFDTKWLTLAERGYWHELQSIWTTLTAPSDTPEDGTVTLFRNGKHGLGVGIVIDNGLLMVHHKRGVIWAPLNAFKSLEYRHFL